eukprot:1179744-Prorocentrum_minimum.AAC.7
MCHPVPLSGHPVPTSRVACEVTSPRRGQSTVSFPRELRGLVPGGGPQQVTSGILGGGSGPPGGKIQVLGAGAQPPRALGRQHPADPRGAGVSMT